uniref:Putative carbohydrate binding protein n=1 Tax=Anopheles aquasalis TaxID=42839 RepID=T1DQT7_ANOAQ
MIKSFNKRNCVCLALALLCQVILISAEVEQNVTLTTDGTVPTTASTVDCFPTCTTPSFNFTDPFPTGTTQDANWTTPYYNWTTPSQNWTTPDCNATWIPTGSTPDANWTIPPVNWTTPDYNWTTPSQNWTTPDYNATWIPTGSTPNANSTLPSQNPTVDCAPTCTTPSFTTPLPTTITSSNSSLKGGSNARKSLRNSHPRHRAAFNSHGKLKHQQTRASSDPQKDLPEANVFPRKRLHYRAKHLNDDSNESRSV